MGKYRRQYRKNTERRIYVRGERHDPPDTYLLARALLDMAVDMAAAKKSANSDVASENTRDEERHLQEERQ
ncbi:hypothetical protein [Nocardia brasiliensis]|uniref:hypothetical protein n=1 Tax=Nocardia brasiliensis TaxID=37326 RepID=UPI0024540399|nr:hypothetical protein [Nocardia brasiliensis]